MKNIAISTILILIVCSCATMAQKDLSKTSDPVPASEVEEPVPVKTEYREKTVYVEKPVYMPFKPVLEEKKKNGEEAVKQSVEDAIQVPDYFQGGMVVYDYDSTFAFNVYTQPLRLTDVQLEPGEIISGQPVTGDTTRWILGAGVSYVNGSETQHVYIKPVKEGLETTLIINTNRRRYYLVLFSFPDVYMMGVCWNYPHDALPLQYIRQGEKLSGAGTDLSSLCFDYTVTFPESNPPVWVPERVFDDGAKTCVVFPEKVLNDEQPAVFLGNGDMVNFRIKGRTIVIDRLIQKIILKLNNISVTISRKENK